MNFSTLLPIKITEKALKEIKAIMATKNIPSDYGLRIGINGSGGCVGISYMLGFDKMKEGDDSFTIEEVKVYIAKKHLMYLIDLEIEYYSGADQQGFSFVKSVAS